MFKNFMSKLKLSPSTTDIAGADTPEIFEAPEGLIKAQDALKAQINNSRAQLAETQRSASIRRPMDRAVIADLYQVVVGEINITKAATLLARVSPSAVMGLDSDAQPDYLAPDATDAALARKFTLYAALLEAGLSEQTSTRGEAGGDSPLSAAALEATFDDWMIRGRHRPGFDGGELAKIDRLIAHSASGPLSDMSLLQTRFGLLLPVLANVHLWRILEAMPPAISAKLGWCAVDVQSSAPSSSAAADVEPTGMEPERG